MAPIPKGVNNVGILTAFGSAGLLVFAYLALSSSVNRSKYGDPFHLVDFLLTAAIIAFAVAGLVLVFPLLNGRPSKRNYYILMAYWALLLVFWLGLNFRDIYAEWNSVVTAGSFVIIVGTIDTGPIVYAIGCMAYFLTKGPKHYFLLSNEHLSQPIK